MKDLFKKPIFWVGFVFVSLLCFVYAFSFFPVAFPIVNIDITTDREQAISLAQELRREFSWGPEEHDVAATFDHDATTQTFVELAGGGQSAFINMIKEKHYMPYQWHVRLFKEFEPNETTIYLTPEGGLYGFSEKISENEVRASLSRKEALQKVLQLLQHRMQIDMTPYALIEAGKDTQQNNRIDRTFVFERSDITLNEGRYRIKAKVCGDSVCRIKEFVKIPQSFSLAYKEIRSANNSIASAATIFALLFYLIIGGLAGIFILMRTGWIIVRIPILWALLVAGLQFLSRINALPLMWMHYQTATSTFGFLLAMLVQIFSSFVFTFVSTALLFIVAEGLTRKAFGNRIRLWESWCPHIANSYTILGYTVSGYLLIGIDMAFLVTFYYIVTTYLHWWSPLSQLADPNILAHYFPWLSSIASSLKAGFVEEAQYRAIPLASAALLGQRFGKKNWWIFVVFILQAIVFGAAHANYAAQPAYARIIELIIPSFIFAGLYLRFGLLVPVVMHYAYDVFWFALPIFISRAPFMWMNQLAVIVCTFIPLIIVLYRRFAQGAWEQLTAQAYNATWKPNDVLFAASTAQQPERTLTLNRTQKTLYAVGALLSCLLLLLFGRFSTDAPPLRLSRTQAITIALDELNKNGISVDGFQAYAYPKAKLEKLEQRDSAHRYIMQSYPKEVYHSLIGTYLNPPHWIVRFLKFNGSLSERAETYKLLIGAKDNDADPVYEVLNLRHDIAEHIPRAQLEKKDARELAYRMLAAKGVNLEELYEISAMPISMPERTDWRFDFGHKLPDTLQLGQARTTVKITGDQLKQITNSIYIPETWKRAERKERTTSQALEQLCNLLIQILCLFGLCLALLLWAYHVIRGRMFIYCLGAYTILYVVRLFNNWPQLIAQFNTTAPFANQAFKTYAPIALQFLLQAIIFSSILNMLLQIRAPYRYANAKEGILAGISSGLLAVCAWTMLTQLQPIAPLWGYYASIGTWSNVLGLVNAQILMYLQYTTVLMFGAYVLYYISDRNKKYLVISLLLCLLAGLCFTSFDTTQSINARLIAGPLFGAVLALLLYGISACCYSAIPIAVATCFVLSLTQQAIFNCIPHIWLSALISGACICLLAYILFGYMRKKHA